MGELRDGLIEAVARVLHNNDPAYAPPYWDDCDEGMQDFYWRSAVAAVDAVLDYLEAHAEAFGWCVAHHCEDAARPDSDDTYQVCGNSLFWTTGERGDCEFETRWRLDIAVLRPVVEDSE